MIQKKLKVFLDTSVIIAAALSPTGGARQIFLLGEAGLLYLLVGPAVLREAEEVTRRKAPDSLPLLAQLLAAGGIAVSLEPTRQQLTMAESWIEYKPDALILAEALAANPDWFISHDKTHFTGKQSNRLIPLNIGTPGDLLQFIKESYHTQ